MSFRGERSFSGTSLFALVQELNRYAGAVFEKFSELDRGGPRRWKKLPDTLGNAAAAYGHSIVVRGGGNATISLPRADTANAGRELCIVREQTTGTIVLLPIGGRVNGSSSTTLATSAGAYAIYFDGVDHWSYR